MSLHQTILHDSKTEILVWKISETLDQLLTEVKLNESSNARLGGMKSVAHQKGFLSVRKLLQERGYTDFDLYYDQFGKPHLYDGRHISISHSHDFSAIILSDKNCGIDLEMQREKIMTIAHKFADEESKFLHEQNQDDYIRQLTIIWGAKEAVFKIRNEVGISFKDHIHLNRFTLEGKVASAILKFASLEVNYNIFFEEVENFTLVYAFEKQ
ncbi:MAG: 4'-phosphopantetheinyl transferase superfamily protein [Flavobacterium sp.]|nr:4'-phosphopantetheinyl transferase superfamily protein [Flavobacterium sp.]